MTPWTFAHVADIHVGSPRSFRFQPAWNENWETARRRLVALRPDLLLVGGDVARDGTLHRYELEAVRDDFQRLPFPAHVVPGNMDTGNKHATAQGFYARQRDIALNIQPEQLRQFESVFGPSAWTFVHRGVRFSGFCDMLLGSGLPEEAALWRWLESVARLPRERFHVWCLHYAVFIETPDEPNYRIAGSQAEYLDWYFGLDNPGRRRLLDLFKASGATLAISGHVHCRKTHFAEGIRFDIAPSTAFAQYDRRWPDGDPTLGFLVYTVGEEAITCAFTPLERVSHLPGYGPGGHVLPEDRDYSIAWEKP
ncbi:MAG: metallophosphoesterase [Lentisphaerae bacterium]|nr:metallophosphoesterase [Lentisphaerota bacterium]